MPISKEIWRERLAAYQAREPALERAKERYDRRQEMLNDPEAQDRYRVQRWEEMGRMWKLGHARSDPIQRIKDVADIAETFRQTFTPEQVEKTEEGFNEDYAGHVQDQEVKEFLIRRANIGQAAFEQHKFLHPFDSDSEAYNAMHRQLLQYGFQPRGLEKLLPFSYKDGKVTQKDYTFLWSEVRSSLLGLIRGSRKLATSLPEMSNFTMELLTDVYNRNRAGAEVTGSNTYRDARRSFAIHMGAMEQILTPNDIPYNFDVAGVIGEQVPNMIATLSGAKMIALGSKLAGNALVLGSMFALEGTDAFNNYMRYGEQQGLDPRLITSRAYAGAMTYGAASAALERLIPVETFKRIPGFKNRIVGWGLGSLSEGTTEFLQSLTQAGIGEEIDLGQFDWDSVRGALREAAAGVIVGGAAGAATIGRVAPQVDRLMETLGPDEIKARIETELDVMKKRIETPEETEFLTPVEKQIVRMTEQEYIEQEIGEEPLGAHVSDAVSFAWQKKAHKLRIKHYLTTEKATKGPVVQPEETVQTTSDAVDRVVTETTGLRSKLRKTWRTIITAPAWAIRKIPAENPIGRLRDSIGSGLSDDYRGPIEWVRGWRQAKGRERGMRFQADLMGAQWVKQLREANLDPGSPELQGIVEMALRGEIELNNLPPAMQAWVQTARTLMDAESSYGARVLHAAGLHSRAEIFEKNIGSYLKRIPLAKVDTIERMKNTVRLKLGMRVSKAFSKVARDAWLVWDGKKLLGKFDLESEAREIYNTAIVERKSQVIKKRAAGEGVSPDDIKRQAAKSIKIEAPIPPEWWRKHGIHNPAYLLAQSMVEARHDTEMVQLFSMAAERWGQEAPQGLSETEIAGWAKENGLAQLPQSNRLHVLKGMFVPKSIASDLNQMVRIPNFAERAYSAYLSAWKSSKTLWNPATHARNIYGNVLVFSFLARCSALNPRNAKFYRQAAKSLSSKDEAYFALLENGALGAEYYGGEIRRIEGELKGAEDSMIGHVLAGIKVAQKTLGQTYAVEDQVFKMAAYHKYLKEGMSPEVAAEEVNKWFPNYERIGIVTRWLRKSPIGAPFISFVDQSVRIAGRGIVERPLQMATLAAIPGVMNYISAIVIGLNPDEKELIDKERGYFEPLVPWRDVKGRAQTLDLRYIVPLANDIIPEERRGGIMLPWIFSGPAMTLAIEQFSGKERFSGREFIREDMTFKERATARAATIARAAVPHPSITYWGTKRIIGSITGERDEHVANAIIGSLIGLNVRSPYIAEKHVKQIIQNMIDEGDWKEGEILLDVWNERYKPRFLKNLRMVALSKGLHLTKLNKWRKVRDEAAEAILQDRDDDAQDIVDDYMTELKPGMRELFMSSVQYRARQFRTEGKTR